MQYFNPDKIDKSDFETRDIWADELHGMFDSVDGILNFRGRKNWRPNIMATRREKRLARKLLQAAKWIEREAAVNQFLRENVSPKTKEELRRLVNEYIQT
jgi:hypothetical protein